MGIDREPKARLYTKILRQRTRKEAAEKDQIDKDYEELKHMGLVHGDFLEGLPEVPDAEIPKIENLIERAMERFRTSHRAHLPERKN